ncbi:nuclear transport factor 2 family protein [Spongiactinospora sp. TRM90649]|uniref:YybH family protein n=1 Tax=Spongiactinospora sp. TRM90649 TaxID=3031114 RepID=UPI0023F9F01A|nr:nuclear transport factor 2 family protein [Spongiactinospora sp. TRM90649]MDF5754493.1 nuclear transport factor 2 family protein [Spongiactinospora sp. TRM90649]
MMENAQSSSPVATPARRQARQPQDLQPLFVERVNDRDLEGLVELYETGAVLHYPAGHIARGLEEIRLVLREFLAAAPRMTAAPVSAVLTGDLALTSGLWTMEIPGPDGRPIHASGKTAEVARRQADGTWRMIIDEPDFTATS